MSCLGPTQNGLSPRLRPELSPCFHLCPRILSTQKAKLPRKRSHITSLPKWKHYKVAPVHIIQDVTQNVSGCPIRPQKAWPCWFSKPFQIKFLADSGATQPPCLNTFRRAQNQNSALAFCFTLHGFYHFSLPNYPYLYSCWLACVFLIRMSARHFFESQALHTSWALL